MQRTLDEAQAQATRAARLIGENRRILIPAGREPSHLSLVTFARPKATRGPRGDSKATGPRDSDAMRQTFLVSALAGALGLSQLAWPQAARAQSSTTLGVGSGAVAGALVAGPIGAVAGAVVGGLVGSSREGRRRRHVRRVRHYATPIRRERRAEAFVRRSPAPVARPAPSSGTAWKDPR